MEQTVDYKEYCRRIDLLRSCVKDIIYNVKFDVLMVESCYQDDELTLGIGTFCECFTEPESMFRYIHDESLDLTSAGLDDEEDVRNRVWWHIKGYVKALADTVDMTRRRKYNDGFCQVLNVDVDIYGNILNVNQCKHLDNIEYWKNNEVLSGEIEWMHDWQLYFMPNISVKLPFNPGDIIYCDSRPYELPFYCIYTGHEKADDKQNEIDLKNKAEWAYKNGDFEQRDYVHTAIRYSVDLKRLVEDRLGNSDCGPDVTFDKMTVVNKDVLQRWNKMPWET